MTDKNQIVVSKKEMNKIDEMIILVEKKLEFFRDVIQKTILHVQKNKMLDILGVSDVSICIERLTEIHKKIKEILELKITNTEIMINNLQNINNELSSLFKNYGTENLDDLLLICLGSNVKIHNNENEFYKLELLKKYFHPISYKVLNKKDENKNSKKKSGEDMFDEKINNLECHDISSNYKLFHVKVYGIKVHIYNTTIKKGLIIYGILDDVNIELLNNRYITNKINEITNNLEEEYKSDTFDKFLSSLILKDFLIHNSYPEILNKFAGYMSQLNNLKQKTISQIVKEFVSDDMFSKRITLIQLLIKSSNYENQYLAYLLYDLLSNDTNGNIDTEEQTILFDSFPWSIKSYFKNAMKKTVQYTNDLSNFEINKIPLEQQICLLKVSDSVKEKAMMKLKEVKAKSEDSGSKARQYLDGLLKIPFNIFKKEPVLNLMDNIKIQFKDICKKYNIHEKINSIPLKEKYTSIEILKHYNLLKKECEENCFNVNKMIEYFTYGDKNTIIYNVSHLNETLTKYNQKDKKIINSQSMKKENIKELIKNLIISLYEDESNNSSYKDILNEIKIFYIKNSKNDIDKSFNGLDKELSNLNNNMLKISEYMSQVKTTLDKAVHGHEKAKKQIERIISQWINGKQDGYCFGFEGPPGVGKCFAKDTPIMLSNGEIKMVQDITINDKLMGDDSKERNILALGNGKEKMYKVQQVKGDDYIVNESHILSLKMTKSGKKGDKHQTILNKRYFKNDIVDINIKDYLALPSHLKKCLKGYKVGIDFPEQNIKIEPYALGCWLGDGTSRNFGITTIDEPIIKYFQEFAKKYNLKFRQGKGNQEITYTLTSGIKGGKSDKNILINILKEYNLLNNKHIPNEYKCNSREVRLQLLAGLIDTDGYYNKYNNSLEITQKNKNLANDILWLVRSLGFRGMMKECIKSCTYKGEKKYGHYYRTTISGKGLQDIPTLLERKKPREHKQIKDCLNTGINIIPLEEDEYFGFQIDGNSRFLLGDFTVTHNTSLAKRGLSDCLKDDKGNSRPFAMIQMGGDSNGSTLHGHNYTYVGSTWGSIVQILIDKKCMNPIIFIDEVDKISRTEHGKEIVGILTHLLDPAQNDCFQDKYFTGIDLDLSKALFILSYNDVDAIDKILLDRVHRIKFTNLSIEDKLVISNTHILPEVYNKMGLENMIEISDEVLKFIIEEYTCESGVRKLKEILFEIVGEINLDILKNNNSDYEIPIKISIDDIKNKYFKDKREIIIRKVPNFSQIGFINGMYATSLGTGGTLPIHAKFYPSEKFLDLKLTGLQQEVMRESMHVSLTVAWNLTPITKQMELRNKFDNKDNRCGINIHTGDGSVSKDGPSAGCAVSCSIYSLLNNIPIKCEFGITGEIQMSGEVTAIGGLSNKILGSIKANVKSFIYPKENKKDFDEFYEKYKDSEILNGIKFYPIENIDEALELILDK